MKQKLFTSKILGIFVLVLGVLLFFQNCGNVKGFSESGNSAGAKLSSQLCYPSENQACVGSNGLGNQICSADGSSYGTCILNSCNSGYTLSAGNCVANSCVANSQTSCAAVNGTGTQICSGGGSYGACTLSSGTQCYQGYSFSAGACVASHCTPGSIIGCQTAAGTGLKVCDVSGNSSIGICNLYSCSNSGFTAKLGVCVPNTCVTGKSIACVFGNGTGTAACNPQGSGYEACVLTACQLGYTLQNGTCVADACMPNIGTIACTAVNGTAGTGIQTCNSAGTGYGACVATACSSGYNLQNGACKVNACTPDMGYSCSGSCSQAGGDPTAAVCTQTCNAYGTYLGACVFQGCADPVNMIVQNGVCTCSNGLSWSGVVCQ